MFLSRFIGWYNSECKPSNNERWRSINEMGDFWYTTKGQLQKSTNVWYWLETIFKRSTNSERPSKNNRFFLKRNKTTQEDDILVKRYKTSFEQSQEEIVYKKIEKEKVKDAPIETICKIKKKNPENSSLTHCLYSR